MTHNIPNCFEHRISQKNTTPPPYFQRKMKHSLHAVNKKTTPSHFSSSSRTIAARPTNAFPSLYILHAVSDIIGRAKTRKPRGFSPWVSDRPTKKRAVSLGDHVVHDMTQSLRRSVDSSSTGAWIKRSRFHPPALPPCVPICFHVL